MSSLTIWSVVVASGEEAQLDEDENPAVQVSAPGGDEGDWAVDSGGKPAPSCDDDEEAAQPEPAERG
jgi:hypothetical protein